MFKRNKKSIGVVTCMIPGYVIIMYLGMYLYKRKEPVPWY